MYGLNHFATKGAAAHAARIFHGAGVPSVLVGWSAIALVGGDFLNNDVDFVVRDSQIRAAANAMVRAGFSPCADAACLAGKEDRASEIDTLSDDDYYKEEAELFFCKDRYHPVPAVHFHMPHMIILSLHRKSRLLWWIPDDHFRLEPPAHDDPYFVLSTDAARVPARDLLAWPGPEEFSHYLPTANSSGSSGPWRGLYPVKVLLATAHLKMALLCLCRDLHGTRGLDWLWFCMLYELAERQMPGQDRASARHLLEEPQLQAFWDRFRGHVDVATDYNILEPLLEYRAGLISGNKLPDLPEGSAPVTVVFVVNKQPVTDESAFQIMDKDANAFPWVFLKRNG
ncbi:uncharacterized protein DSM5745_05936 [Aspergillus mulundensis]|uniref:Uncharacterized protein n=1 Tax=Aspergillus mulundensis TaxID=1810919 RepID=A0A3D8RZ00_9EURO|nr:hypothetical protein DSM5745_05936 [Aspergillus mulundensis]RDW79084.1 hypothetical protein DSM5745_05936 [Aspergillus mulundensis]